MDIKLKFRGVWVVPVVLILDRLLKAWAARAGARFVIVPGVLGFRYAENTGAAFSMLSGITAILAIVTAILVALVTLYLFVGKSIPTVGRYALWLVVAGGLGNLYDRIFFGHVVDFLEFLFVRFAIFNFADICLTCGACLAVLSYLMDDYKKGNAHGGDDPVSR